MPKNIFVIGLEDFNLQLLRAVRHAEDYVFHRLLEYRAVAGRFGPPVNELLAESYPQLDAFPDSIDAIVGYWDFPTILMMPLLRRRYGLRGPTLESVLKCEHKYWARLVQREVNPDIIPPFVLVDPFADETLPLPFPFWIKPVKAHSSILGFRVDNLEDYRAALKAIRAGISEFAVSFNQILEYADLPSTIQEADGWKCIAEGIISAGRQCTLEGFVFEGEPQVYGIVDSIRGPNRSSFERYEYPSTLPIVVRERMIAAAKRVIRATGLDDSPFNMEFYWTKGTDQIWLLETNARISKSHSPVFQKVEGVPHNEVMIDVALGRTPEYPLGLGKFRHAAKFMVRRYDCGDSDTVAAVPSEDQLRTIERRFPDTEVELHVKRGMRLADLSEKDSYSHELAVIFAGANSHAELMRKYREIMGQLHIEISRDR